MRKHILKPGQTFGRLKVLHEHGKTKRGETLWLCRCSCGVEKAVAVGRLRRGSVSSCGCLRRETAAAQGRNGNRTHGHASTGKVSRTYQTWMSMTQRCTNPKAKGWESYGGRGITVCNHWQDFENFVEDMGERPKGRTLDRIDPNGNYEKNNCRWATGREQGETRRNVIIIEHGGESRTLRGWSDHLRIPYATIYQRFRNGWPVDKLLNAGDHRYR